MHTLYLLVALAPCFAAIELTSEDLETHPRPDWARPCIILNGAWAFEFDPDDVGLAEKWHEEHGFTKEIQVPFPWQSELSGIHDPKYKGTVWYQRDITVPGTADGRRYFLVFGAVDWHATVWVNGQKAVEHENGYLPFEVELTDLVKPGETAKVTVRAYDVTDPETPTGKQTGWYTQTGGIWQTVYLEFRGQSYVRKARITPDIDNECAQFECTVEVDRAGTYMLEVEAVENARRFKAGQRVNCKAGPNEVRLVLPIESPALWTPDSPTLYDTRVFLKRGRRIEDTVQTYFGMRKVSRGPYGGSDYEYILLNNKPVYLRGALHQSFNPKGVYTHPDDDFIRNDYAKAKEFGLNFIRIHIKVDEPRALYWADKLGVVLMCDIPNFSRKTPRSKRLWEETLRGTISRDFNHPSIIAWCDFNETWGIADGGYDRETQEWVRDMYLLTKELDPTRLAEDNSPCRYDHTVTDINSWHFYIDRFELARSHIAGVVEQISPGSEFNYADGWKQDTAPLINSEYGGVSAGGGDRDVSWVFIFLTNLLRKYDKICGYVYTELSDIEWEHNGFMNYDRSPKEYHYPAGITLADLQDEEFPVLDCPPYQRVEAGSQVSIPVLLSHWSERQGLKLRIFADGTTVDGIPWKTWVKPSERDVAARPYVLTDMGSYDIQLPDANGLMNVVAEVLVNGERCAANYCVLDVRGGQVWSGSDVYASSFPVHAFSGFSFENAARLSQERPDKVLGHGAGFIEYQLRLPRRLRAKDIAGCRLIAEVGSKADTERLDWPSRRKPQDYPQTDGNRWPTDVTLSVNGVSFTEVAVENDFADARGVLSHVAHYHHGSSGVVVDAPIEGEALEALKKGLHKTVTLRFEVRHDAGHQGGLALYGNGLGSYPADPTLVFTLNPGARKPKNEAKVVNAAGARAQTFIEPGPSGHVWRYTTEQPAQDWFRPGFNDKSWRAGKAGFGSTGTPGARIGTQWSTSDIWLRTTATLPRKLDRDGLWLSLHHDEDVDVYVNGKRLLVRKGHTTDYERIALSEGQSSLFEPGKPNLIAVHCRQTAGGQFIDLSLTGIR